MSSLRRFAILISDPAKRIIGAMPIFNEVPGAGDWVEPDDVPRPVVTYGVKSEAIGAIELEPHSHARAQLLMVRKGSLTCELDDRLWIVPPRSALWIPGGTRHSIRASGTMEGYGAFFADGVPSRLPAECYAVAVSSLLRELIIRAAALPLLYEEGGADSRMLDVLMDEISGAGVEDLHVPVPSDPRLRRLARAIMEDPVGRRSLDRCAAAAGMSTRSLERAIAAETGMSFGRWRQRLTSMLAVQRLSNRQTIQQVALDLGYESVPSFATMFRRTLGTSPGRFMSMRVRSES